MYLEPAIIGDSDNLGFLNIVQYNHLEAERLY